MSYQEFINLIDRLNIDEVDAFTIIYCDNKGVEKSIKLDDLL